MCKGNLFILAASCLLLACHSGTDLPSASSRTPSAASPNGGAVLSAEPESPATGPENPTDSVIGEELRRLFDDEQALGRLFPDSLRRDLPDVDIAPDALPGPPGWMNCEGFLTRNPDQGFCEDEPPADWRPFEFEGQRYFVVPLG